MAVQDRSAIITGGGSGIGRAIASRFANAGARVVIADVDEARAEAVRQELVDDGAQALAIPTDVTDEAAVGAMVKATASAFGRVDILVNCAAAVPADELVSMDATAWDADVAVVLRGSFLCTRTVLPLMIDQGRGAIVNIASVNAFGFYGNEAYSAAKAGVINLTMTVAVRYGEHGVRINAIAPGTVRTPIWQERIDKDPAIMDKLVKWYPLGRVGEPEDIANAALFLASDEAAWITGTVLRVDGGLLSGNGPMTKELLVETYG